MDSDTPDANSGSGNTPPTPATQCPIYVSPGGSWSNTGESWEKAKSNVADALHWAQEIHREDSQIELCEIWVAAGSYVPGGKRESTFQLVDKTSLYGGFAGGETSVDQRDPLANQTILSGNIGDRDSTKDNLYHVLTGAKNVLIDGFHITGGNANGAMGYGYGGAIYNVGASIAFRNCQFEGNNASRGGGAIFNGENTDFHCDGCIFWKNTANEGAAIYMDASGGSVYRSIIASNTAAESGAGVAAIGSSVGVFNSVLVGNEAVENGGGILLTQGAEMEVVNCSFTGNGAVEGSGIFGDQGILLKVENSIVWRNTSEIGPQIVARGEGDEPSEDQAIVSYSDIADGCDELAGVYCGDGNIDEDPMFLSPGADPYTMNFSLSPDSPCVDVGNNDAAMGETDLEGKSRIINGTIDMGAIELETEEVK